MSSIECARFGQRTTKRQLFSFLNRFRNDLESTATDIGWGCALGLVDQEVDVFGHYNVADQRNAVAMPNLIEHVQNKIARANGSKKGLAAIATASDEMQVGVSVAAFETLGHARRPPFSNRRVGHPPMEFGPLQLAQSYHPVAPAVKMGIETHDKDGPPANCKVMK